MAWELKLFLKKCIMEVRLVSFSICKVDRLQTMTRRTLNIYGIFSHVSSFMNCQLKG